MRPNLSLGFHLMTRQRRDCILGLILVVFAFLPACDFAGDLQIVGSEKFSNQVCHAVALLKTKDANAYAILTNYVGRIEQGKHSGMWAYRNPPTFEVTDATTFYSLTWCAAVIAHDSYHSKLYHEYCKTHAGEVPDAVWTGTVAEQQCMKHQLAVMERIGASKLEIDYARQQADGHYVKNTDTWDDYRKRDW